MVHCITIISNKSSKMKQINMLDIAINVTVYVAAMMTLDNVGFVANMASMVLYFLNVMHYDLSGSATTTTNYLGTAFLLTLVGGFISDAYMTRLNTGLLFGALEVLVKFTSHVETSIHSLLNSLLLT